MAHMRMFQPCFFDTPNLSAFFSHQSYLLPYCIPQHSVVYRVNEAKQNFPAFAEMQWNKRWRGNRNWSYFKVVVLFTIAGDNFGIGKTAKWQLVPAKWMKGPSQSHLSLETATWTGCRQRKFWEGRGKQRLPPGKPMKQLVFRNQATMDSIL